MSMQDPIAEMLNIIYHGQSSRKDKVSVFSSKVKVSIIKVLQEEGFIKEYLVQRNIKPVLEIFLKYYNKNKPVIENIKRISRPGLRVYKSKDTLPRVMSGMGIAIISTSKGIMTDDNARKLNIGGEIICYVS